MDPGCAIWITENHTLMKGVKEATVPLLFSIWYSFSETLVAVNHLT